MKRNPCHRNSVPSDALPMLPPFNEKGDIYLDFYAVYERGMTENYTGYSKKHDRESFR